MILKKLSRAEGAERLKAAADEIGGSLEAKAAALGVPSSTYLSQMLRNEKPLTPHVAARIGLQREMEAVKSSVTGRPLRVRYVTGYVVIEKP